MPQIQSAKKRMRQNEKKRVANRQVKSRMRTAVKSALQGLEAGVSGDERRKLLSLAFKRIDKAAKKNIIHPNNAARKKSGLAKKFAAKTPS
jgi:small subunit ribosomal protein S20